MKFIIALRLTINSISLTRCLRENGKREVINLFYILFTLSINTRYIYNYSLNVHLMISGKSIFDEIRIVHVCNFKIDLFLSSITVKFLYK